MEKSKPVESKDLLLEVFDTLSNKRELAQGPKRSGRRSTSSTARTSRQGAKGWGIARDPDVLRQILGRAEGVNGHGGFA
jgi:hypothetical protein